MSTVPIPGTSWVRILSGYRCMHTPGVSVFAKKKKISWYGLGRVRYKLGTDGTKTKPDGIISTWFLLLSYSILSPLSQAKPLDSLSHFLTLPLMGNERCSDCGLAVTKAALIIIWWYIFFISLLNMKIWGKQNHKANMFFCSAMLLILGIGMGRYKLLLFLRKEEISFWYLE